MASASEEDQQRKDGHFCDSGVDIQNVRTCMAFGHKQLSGGFTSISVPLGSFKVSSSGCLEHKFMPAPSESSSRAHVINYANCVVGDNIRGGSGKMLCNCDCFADIIGGHSSSHISSVIRGDTVLSLLAGTNCVT